MARKKRTAKATVKATRVFDGDDLRTVVAGIEDAMDAVNEATDSLKALKKEAAARGYSLKALRKVIGEHRAKDPKKVEEERAIEELYRQVLDLTPMEEIMQADADEAPARPARSSGAGVAEGAALQ